MIADTGERVALADLVKPSRPVAPGSVPFVGNPPASAPRYRVLEKTFLHGRVWEPGEIVPYEGKPGKSLEPVKAAVEAEEPKPKADQKKTSRDVI